MTDRQQKLRDSAARTVADTARNAEQTTARLAVGSRVKDRLTGRSGMVRGLYGRQYLVELDIAKNTTRRPDDNVYRAVGDLIAL